MAQGSAGGAREVVALDCRLGSYRCGIPLVAIQRIQDFDVTPLPMAKNWVGGVAQAKDQLLVSVTLHGGGSAAVRRTKGVVVLGAGSACAVEVDETRSFLELKRSSKSFSPQLPSWVKEASLGDGGRIACIDVDALFEELRAAM